GFGGIDAVLLIGFGGPTKPSEVLPFLRHVVRGHNVPERRVQEVARHYEKVGGSSPYHDLTDRQARSLARWLAARGSSLPVYVGMRNWHPFLSDTITRMRLDGCRHAVGVILAPHRCETSWDRYQRDVARAIAATGGDEFSVRYLDPWHDDPGFIEACAQRLEECLGPTLQAEGEYRRGEWPDRVSVVFTAHSIPLSMADGSSYVEQIRSSCHHLADLLGIAGWRLAYQSRSGPPGSAWLAPDINDVIRVEAERGTRAIIVQAIGFLSDHVEILFDLDVQAASTAARAGVRFLRATCVNDHPEFIAMLGRRILHLAGDATR
ncbi:MAG: ferrochelatase, partial [Acidobacteriota bacterium]